MPKSEMQFPNFLTMWRRNNNCCTKSKLPKLLSPVMIFGLKMTKMHLQQGVHPRPWWGAYTAPKSSRWLDLGRKGKGKLERKGEKWRTEWQRKEDKRKRGGNEGNGTQGKRSGRGKGREGIPCQLLILQFNHCIKQSVLTRSSPDAEGKSDTFCQKRPSNSLKVTSFGIRAIQ